MSERQANRNVELAIQGLLDSAQRLRQKATIALMDRTLSDAERDEIREGLERTLELIEARVRWWKTGKGPCP